MTTDANEEAALEDVIDAQTADQDIQTADPNPPTP